MAVSVNTSGSQTCTISTEHTLATISTAGIYTPILDFNAGTDGDIFEVRLYGKARSTDTERLIWVSIVGPIKPQEVLPQMPANVSPHHYKLTLKQTAGTGRAIPWAIYSTGA